MKFAWLFRPLACALAAGWFCSGPAGDAQAAAPVDFNRQIRPLLADKCFACHGPDESKRDSDLRLDIQAGTLAEINGHHAIVPGKPDESELIRRIASQNADERMPPADSNKQLSADEIELVRRWIAEGAIWREHWAYRPIERPAVPPLPTGSVVTEPDRCLPVGPAR